ncbi:copper resistance protein B [Alloalcanivorax gelatiniphagus]|uniref:Copper resistance protein B n=1 Tax=Alloalcanivorax gelatiniphagus TaxID=1194167 RepID=A0ABY2XIV9_9GAMM|nr:copper resistance protein B [Alloalcanivorax gelatiniphagus]TMW11283.1 copper resistance protein B [Alloalcanivorax gelatiniphagus]
MKQAHPITAAALLALSPLVQAMDKHEPAFSRVIVDEFETRDADEGTVAAWEAAAWYGGDLNKLYLSTEGERLMDNGGETEGFETRVAWNRAFAPFWDWQLGARRDWQPDDPNRDWASLGVQGVAPYRFETDVNLFIGEDGLTQLRLETEYELLFTQKLILVPALEMNLAGKADDELNTGDGLMNLEAGLRLRYEVRREFAPYIGVNWERQFGDTASRTRDAGGEVEETTLVAGVRLWF